MKKIQPRASPSASMERSPFKDLTNKPIDGNANTTNVQSEKKLSWYARLSDEEKAEHLKKLRTTRQQKKATLLKCSNSDHASQSHASPLSSEQCTPVSTVNNTQNNGTIINYKSKQINGLFLLYRFMVSCSVTDGNDIPACSLGIEHPCSALPSEQCTPLSNITNTHNNGTVINLKSKLFICLLLLYGFMVSCCFTDGTDHPPEENVVGRKKRSGQGWYGRLSEDKKEEYRKKQRLARLKRKSEAHVDNMDVPQPSIHRISPGKDTYIIHS